jgi:putative transposase
MIAQTKRYNYRIYPNAEQVDFLNKSLGCGRFIWNQLLDRSIKEYQGWKDGTTDAKPDVSQAGLSSAILPIKAEFPWLNEVSAALLQQKARDLGSAFTRFFKGKGKIGFPKFKSRRGHNTVRLVGHALRIKESQFYIGKCKDPIKTKWSRLLPSNPSSCTISKVPAGEWYVSFVCETDPTLTNGSKVVGLDFGLSYFLIDSDGNKTVNPRHYVVLEKRLTRLQRQCARKQKGSNNREKARIKVAKLHQRISNMRNDFLHKLSRQLVNENQVIGIETLRVKNMMRNRSLAKHIADASWNQFVRYLTYKVEESQHCILVKMEAFYPSTHICSVCDTKLDRKLDLKERKWTCSCGAIHDRDINAAKNMQKQAMLEVQHLKPIGGTILVAHDLD